MFEIADCVDASKYSCKDGANRDEEGKYKDNDGSVTSALDELSH